MISEDDLIIIQILLVGTIIGLVLGLFIGRFLISKTSEPIIYEQGDLFIRAIPDLDEWNYIILIEKIISCESKGDPKICNRKYGCRAGMGLCGFISGTWNTTLDRMKENDVYMPDRCWQKVVLPVSKERTEAVFDPECNYLAGMWLLRHDGTCHWGYRKADWGSFKCWSL